MTAPAVDKTTTQAVAASGTREQFVPDAKSDPGTEYVILAEAPAPSQNSASSVKPGTWYLAGAVTARDTNQAIEKYAADKGNKEGTFVALPASRWKPVRVTPQTVTTLKLEEAK